MALSHRARAYVSDVRAWLRDADETRLAHVVRSPYSGVPHDVGAAYTTLAKQFGSIFDCIAHQRLALPSDQRSATMGFIERLRMLRSHALELDDAALDDRIIDTFALHAADDGNEHGSPHGETTFDLRERSVPDSRASVRARQAHFSASALNAYAECPRKWYYRYVCGAVEDAGSSASFYGTAFHLALENFHAEYPQPFEANADDMRAKAQMYINEAFAQHRDDFGSAIEFELQQRRAQRTAMRYVDWVIAESARAPFRVIGRELAVTLDLGGFAFVGFIDRLDRDEATGNVSVLDYKTGAIATTAAEYRESVRRFTDFQLPFYYWARTEQGDRVTRLALLPLKDSQIDVDPVVLEVVPVPAIQGRRNDAHLGTIGIDELERARIRMIEICEALTDGSIETFPVATDASACTYCAYAIACIARPTPERERFGR